MGKLRRSHGAPWGNSVEITESRGGTPSRLRSPVGEFRRSHGVPWGNSVEVTESRGGTPSKLRSPVGSSSRSIVTEVPVQISTSGRGEWRQGTPCRSRSGGGGLRGDHGVAAGNSVPLTEWPRGTPWGSRSGGGGLRGDHGVAAGDSVGITEWRRGLRRPGGRFLASGGTARSSGATRSRRSPGGFGRRLRRRPGGGGPRSGGRGRGGCGR